MRLSNKQKEFWREPFHRWNIKSGATRSGKTYLDYFIIMRSIRERAGKEGLIVLMGNTKGTLQRNVIDPMQNLFGAAMVSQIRSDNTATLFGEKVYCLGADNKKHVDRIRGASVKYCYGDEVVTWEQEVFEMLKSRLDKPYSRFDGTCNPKDPDHWLKQFIDGDADVFYQQYSLDDNPFLDPTVKAEMKKEHSGVFYRRYIDGEWCTAEGLVFPMFADEPERWLCDVSVTEERGIRQICMNGMQQPVTKIVIGLDFGASGSLNTMEAVGILGDYSGLLVLEEDSLPRENRIDTERIASACADFCERVRTVYGRYDYVFFDAADPALGNRVAAILQSRGLPWRTVGECVKTPLEGRPVTVDGLLCSDRLRISRRCKGLISALSKLRWDEDKNNIPEDKNLGNINDFWDSFCYAWTSWQPYFDRRKT